MKTIHLRHFFFLSVIFSSFLLIGLQSLPYNSGMAQEDSGINNDTPLLTYNNPNYGVEIQYPSNWKINETDLDPQDRLSNIVTFLSPFDDSTDVWSEYIDVYYDNIGYEADLNEYLDETITAYEQYDDFEIVSQNTFSTLSGLPAYELVYTYTYEEEGSDDIKVKSYEIGTILNNYNGYFIKFESEENQYDNYFPIAKQAINSFKIEKEFDAPGTG